MNNEKIRETLIAVIRTLDTLTVRGRENMDRLLGCMNAIDQVIASLNEEPAAEEPEEEA